jgi:hypothetical protein
MEPGVSLPHSQGLSACSYSEPGQSSPHHPIQSLQSILILPTHLLLCLPSCLFPSGFPTNNLYTFLFSPIRATCPSHLILIDFILIILDEECKSWSFPLCSFLHPPVTSFLLGPNIPLNTLSMFLLECQRLSFTLIHNHRQNYSRVYSNF